MVKKLVLGLPLLLLPAMSYATTYSNSFATSVCCVYTNEVAIRSFGESFTAPETTLSAWTFYIQGGTAGNFDFIVASWNGTTAIGPALYETEGAYGGGQQSLTFSDIALSLTPGDQYIAIITTAGVADPLDSAQLAAANDTAGLQGGFYYTAVSGTDPLNASLPWTKFPPVALQFTAVFDTVPTDIPEPPAAILLGGCLLGLGALRRRPAPASTAGEG